MKERNYSLDILRIIACIMVIIIHAPQQYLNYSGFFLVGSSMLAEPCVGLFFMISGSLLLPIHSSFQDFIKKRMNKVLIPTLVFSFLYCILKHFVIDKNPFLSQFILSIISIPFSCQGSKVLWFMYPMIGMYLLAPIISPFFEKSSKKEFQIVLILWLISLTFKTLSNFLIVKTDEEGLLYYFYGYVGYFLLGYYIKRFPIHIPLLVFPFLIGIPLAVCFIDHVYDFHIETGYLSLFCVMQTIAWYQFIMQYVNCEKFPQKIKEVVANISDCSFGIYLIHSLIIFNILWYISLPIDFFPIIRFFFDVFVTFIASWLLTYFIAHTKIGKYIVGLKKS